MNYGAAGGDATPFGESFFRQFLSDLSAHVGETPEKRFLFFIHGCCSSIDDSFTSAAELATAT